MAVSAAMARPALGGTVVTRPLLAPVRSAVTTDAGEFVAPALPTTTHVMQAPVCVSLDAMAKSVVTMVAMVAVATATTVKHAPTASVNAERIVPERSVGTTDAVGVVVNVVRGRSVLVENARLKGWSVTMGTRLSWTAVLGGS